MLKGWGLTNANEYVQKDKNNQHIFAKGKQKNKTSN